MANVSRTRTVFRGGLLLMGVGICFMLLLFLLGLLLGPRRSGGKSRPQITISKETTRLTEPLRADGYVDYIAALNQELGAGVTPDNNAAVDLLYASGPEVISASIRKEYLKLLGVPAPPQQGDYLRPLKDFETFGEPPADAAKDTPDEVAEPAAEVVENGAEELAEEAIEFVPTIEAPRRPNVAEEQGQAMQRGWTADQYPRLAAWLEANQGPLERAVIASSKPRWYAPLVAEDGLLIQVLLPQVQDSREYARLLTTQAMFRLGSGDPEGAWQDLLACHRLARLVGQGSTLVERLTATSLEKLACEGDFALALEAKLPGSRLVEMQAELGKLPPLPAMKDSIDGTERYMFLNMGAEVAEKGPAELDKMVGMNQSMGASGNLLMQSLNGLARSSIDWDVPLRMGNQYYDRIVAAAEIADPTARRAALAALEDELRGLEAATTQPPEIADLFSPRAEMGKRMGNILLSRLLPAMQSCLDAQQRSMATLTMTRLALSLAAYRADHGSYPARLDELAPKYIDPLPRDSGSDGEYHYQRTEDGYRLYSVGPNGQDDQGRGPTAQPRGDDVLITVPPEPEQSH
jgi:hypothetical protein